jgi:hypothetical protein
VKYQLDTSIRRIIVAIGISLLLHGLVMWGPNIQLPHFSSSLPPLTAKLERLPSVLTKAKLKRKVSSAPKPEQKPEPEIEPAAQTPPSEEPTLATNSISAASSVTAARTIAAASTPPASETPAQSTSENVVERPQLPRRAQLIFTINNGSSDFKIGETIHTLEIDDGHYVLQSVTETVGLAKLFKTYRLTQYSSGSYSKQGLRPDQFFEERAERFSSTRSTVEFDHTAQRAHFSNGEEIVLPPDTQDILSILYQFPPLANAEMVAISVSNSKKIEYYEFEITPNEDIQTKMGKLQTIHLRKVHKSGEDGLEVWLALEYRLFPVKMRMIEKNGDVSGEAIITEIHAEFDDDAEKNVTH